MDSRCVGAEGASGRPRRGGNDPALPYRLIDGSGADVRAVSEFLHDMLADDASRMSLRS